MHDRPARYVKNTDGDSVTMLLDQDYYDFKQVNIRLANVWAPDGDQEGVLETKWFVQDWFMTHLVHAVTPWNFIVYSAVTRKGTMVKTFDRYVADITTMDGKHHLNSDVMKFLLEHGYEGGIGAISRVG